MSSESAIINSRVDTGTVVDSKNVWYDRYKNEFVEKLHDNSQLDLVLPDDSLIFVGPARLYSIAGDAASSNDIVSSNNIYIVGYVNQLQWQQQRQVQPMKAIGSHRHIFAATNAPVSGNMARLAFIGKNVLHAFYGKTGLYDSRNEQVVEASDKNSKNSWYTNLEEDMYRIPFGLGVIYKSPRLRAVENYDSTAVGGEYFECCVLTGHQQSITAGQSYLMEQVSFLADRVVPIKSFASADNVK